ncbi:MAG: HyaD/HybD family hydrogenase maturation endopeptidase [Desulfobulbales bacterium]|nr:HyaD/HybD family hydrogenase maturation endopeptidase [Desulfobulbales bacterium]
MDILILGIGNVLLTDEGIGVRALKELERRYCFPENVELLDGGTAGIELLRHIRNRDYLIIIDAMKFGREPGTVSRLEGDDVPAAFRTRISPHQLGLSDLLAAAMLTNELPKKLVLFGVEPKSLDIGLDLTATVEASVDKLVAAVADELRALDCSVMPVDTTFTEKARFWDTI